MSAGLRRVPSFSGRPGFPNGLQVLPAYICAIGINQLGRISEKPIHMGLFKLLQVLVVDAEDQSSICLQQKLQELSYEGSPQPAYLCRMARWRWHANKT